MDPRLRSSLVAVQLVGLATLLRSIAYDRWITVLASVLLIIGATAAQRGRVWGVALSFGAAAAFPVAWAIGIAPAWFCLVGMVGSLPFALASPSLARFDKGAAALLAAAAASAGTLGAVAWKEMAWSLFARFPSLLPSGEAQHGLALLAVVSTAAIAMRLRDSAVEEGQHVRIAEHARVAEIVPGDVHAEEDVEADEQGEKLRRAEL